MTQQKPNSTPSAPRPNDYAPQFATIPQTFFSLDAERAVLGSILINPAALDDIGDMLAPSDFWQKTHGDLYAAMLALSGRDIEIDALTVADSLSDAQLKDLGGRAYLVQLCNETPTSANAVHYADIVRRDARRRDFLRLGDDMKALAHDETLTHEQIIERAEVRIDALRATLPEPDERTALEGRDRALDYVEAVAARERETHVPTGIHKLDSVLRGGVGRGELAVVIAQRHIGKTSLGFNIATNALRADKRVLYVTVEFGYDKMLRQMIAFKSGVPSAHFERGSMTPDQYGLYVDAAGWMGAHDMHILAKQPVTMHKIARRTRVLSRLEKPLDLVIVDFVQGLHMPAAPENKGWGIYDRMVYWTTSMVNLAAECNVAVIAMAQAHRKAKGRMPDMEEIEGGDFLAQRADVVVGLHRPPESKTTLELGIHKNRVSGEVTTVSVMQESGTRRIL